jgi:uncharacterized membrane protein
MWSPKSIALSILVVSLVLIIYERHNPSLVLPVIGVASFAIPIVLSFDDRYNLGTRLDNGEVRKSIAIALTVVYIIMLSLFFINLTLPQQLGNASAEEDQKSTSGLVTGNALILPLAQPAAAEVQSASTNEDINDLEEAGDAVSSSDSEKTEGSEVSEEETGETDNSENPLIAKIKDSALSDIYSNFLYVYILIIGFYFGSRVFEDFAAVRMTKELTGSDPRDLLERRFAMGEISKDDYNERINALIGSDPKDLLKMRLAIGEISEVYYEKRIELLKKQ